MNTLKIMAAGLFGMVSVSALAQAQSTETAVGARAGQVRGDIGSEPRSTKASNIVPSNTNRVIAPELPSPGLGPDATSRDYLRVARVSLAAGRTGKAQQSLEMAETRALSGSETPAQAQRPSDSPKVDDIQNALFALGNGDLGGAMRLVDTALGN